jgi:hypothetical protein
MVLESRSPSNVTETVWPPADRYTVGSLEDTMLMSCTPTVSRVPYAIHRRLLRLRRLHGSGLADRLEELGWLPW